MKRSEINAAIDFAAAALKKENITLPCFAHFTREHWSAKKDVCDNIFSVMLGWDVTDFASDDFAHCGCVLFTVRNGSVAGQK